MALHICRDYSLPSTDFVELAHLIDCSLELSSEIL